MGVESGEAVERIPQCAPAVPARGVAELTDNLAPHVFRPGGVAINNGFHQPGELKDVNRRAIQPRNLFAQSGLRHIQFENELVKLQLVVLGVLGGPAGAVGLRRSPSRPQNGLIHARRANFEAANVGARVAPQHPNHAIGPAAVKTGQENAVSGHVVAGRGFKSIEFSRQEEPAALQHAAPLEVDPAGKSLKILESLPGLGDFVAGANHSEGIAIINAGDVLDAGDNVAPDILDGLSHRTEVELRHLKGAIEVLAARGNVVPDLSEVGASELGRIHNGDNSNRADLICLEQN